MTLLRFGMAAGSKVARGEKLGGLLFVGEPGVLLAVHFFVELEAGLDAVERGGVAREDEVHKITAVELDEEVYRQQYARLSDKKKAA